jgi:hypothetical protein
MPRGWLTPDSIPSATKCRTLVIPDELAIIMAVSGALVDLTYAHNWQKFGAVEPEEIADAMRLMYLAFVESLNDCEPAVTIPIGSIMQFAAATQPDGWLFCDGNNYLKADYNDLWLVIGTLWGVSPLGSDYFVVPDFRNRSPYGYDYGASPPHFAFASQHGAENHTLITSEIPSHQHDIWSGALYAGFGAGAAGAGPSGAGTALGYQTGNKGGGGAHNTLHPVVTCGFIIYAGV